MRGSITQRSPGSWTIQVSGRSDDAGKRVRLTRTIRGSKRDAERAMTKLQQEVDSGKVVLGDRELVADYLERWIVHRAGIGKLRPKTMTVYRGYVRRNIAPHIGGMRVGDVRPVHVQRVVDEATGAGLSARTVTQVRAILRAAFATAVRWQVVAYNPVDGTSPPKVEAPKLTTPTPTDIGKLLAMIEPEYRTVLAVSAGTGMRRGEVLALRWPDVDLDGSRPGAQVKGTLQRVGGTLTVLPPKSARSRRRVSLPPSLVGVLRVHRAAQLERRLLAGPGWAAGEYVFDRGDGRPVDPDAFSAAFRRARHAAGLTDVRLHDLRHAFADMLVAAGTNARVVSDALGHATVAFTLQTYVHPDEAAADAVSAETERLLGPAIG